MSTNADAGLADPYILAWDSSGGPEIVACYEVVQGWDGAEIWSTVTGLSVPLPARTGTAYAARVRALPVDQGTEPSNWATLAAEWPDAIPQIFEPLVSCLWGDDDGIWETGCNHAFKFNDGDPTENQFGFCPYCGKPLVVIDYDDVDNSSSLDGSGS